MNFDLNMLSTLMQLMGKQPGGEQRQTDIPASSAARSGRQTTASSFVLENGIGEKVRITADSAPSPQASSPIASILEMMGGRMGGADGMSALMPMLMGLLGKGDKGPEKNVDAEKAASPSETADSHHNDAKHSAYDGYATDTYDMRGDHAGYAREPHKNCDDTYDACGENFQNASYNAHGSNKNIARQSKYAPISYAGYALISALNLLCRHVYG